MKFIKLIRTTIGLVAILFATLVIANNIGADGWSVICTAVRNNLGVIFQTMPAEAYQEQTANFSNIKKDNSFADSTLQSSPLSIKNANNTVFYPSGKPKLPGYDEIIGNLKAGSTLAASLRSKNISAKVRTQIINTLCTKLDLRRLKPSDQYTIVLDQQGDLRSCVYNVGPLESYTISANADGYKAEKDPIKIEIKTVRISAQINSSLFASFTGKHEDFKLIYAFADIFASRIDFNTETHMGDTYSIIFDKYYKDGTCVGYGKIKSASYNGESVALTAYYFQTGKNVGAYFDADGQAVGSQFIRSPLPMGRLTSKFSYHRRHPITGIIQPHLGIDLAAPTGTPIMAAGDGRIISIGRNGGNGKQIVLAHSGGYRTYYGHMSRYKKGLHKGSIVHKKDIIGYVGSTGLATGPHLDYRIRHNGVFKNPFSIAFKPRIVLAQKDIPDFNKQVEKMAIQMKNEYVKNHEIIKVSSVTLSNQKKNNLTIL